MATTHEPSLQLYRHASDNMAFDCGRACAQAIISSLTQGVPAGNPPTPADKAQPVPVTQAQLKALEADQIDAPGKWFTHPDELVDLLRYSPQLASIGLTDWRVASGQQAEVLEHVAASLVRGMPAILNIRPNDHWVLVRNVDRTNGIVSFVRLLDPLNKQNAPSALNHTYVDGCANDGLVVRETLDLDLSGSLGANDLPVGTFLPANYAGKHVAIVYGPGPSDVAELLDLRERLRRLRRRPVGPTPLDRILAELMRVSAAYEVPEVTALLRERKDPIIRFVHDIDARERGYTMSAVFSEALGYGLIGVYDFGDQAFLHAMLTSGRELVEGLAGDSAEPLWWTRRPLDTLFSPYYPFRRVPGQLQPTYRRLADDLELVVPPPKGAQGA